VGNLTPRFVGPLLLLREYDLGPHALTAFEEESRDEQRLRTSDHQRKNDNGAIPLPWRRLAKHELRRTGQTRFSQCPPPQLTPIRDERVLDRFDARQ
jgi:hypothetical protein